MPKPQQPSCDICCILWSCWVYLWRCCEVLAVAFGIGTFCYYTTRDCERSKDHIIYVAENSTTIIFEGCSNWKEADILLVPRGKMVSKAWTLSSTNPPIVTPPTGQSSCSKKVRIAKDGRTKFKMYGRLHTREKFELKIEFTRTGHLVGRLTRSLGCPVHERVIECRVYLTFQ